MKFSAIVFILGLCCVGKAATEHFGFWNAQDINYDWQTRQGSIRKGTPDEFAFSIDDSSISSFLTCVTLDHMPKGPIFLFGSRSSAGNLVTNAFICDGEIDLGNCTKKRASCDKDDAYLKRVYSLVTSEVGNGPDIRIDVSRTVEGVCGGEGPSLAATVKLRKWNREIDSSTGELKLVESWDLAKTYGISLAELKAEPSPKLMDLETCIE